MKERHDTPGLYTIVGFAFFLVLLTGCATKHELNDTSDKPSAEKPQSKLLGRWLIEGQAGDKMHRSIQEADRSIVIMTKVFDTTDTGVVGGIADELVKRAKNGVNVNILLSRDFPVSFFNRVNDRTEKRFSGTPVNVTRVRSTGKFRYEGAFTKVSEKDGYVNSALLLVDGRNLFTGNFIFMKGDLTGSTSNIIQLKGDSVYHQTKQYLPRILDAHQVSHELSEIKLNSALSYPGSGWHEVHNLDFRLGTQLASPLMEFFKRAEDSVTISVDNGGYIRSARMQSVLAPLIEHKSRLQIEWFYETCREHNWCLPHYFVDIGEQAYQYREDNHQYQRFATVDSEWFYTGTADMTLLYLNGDYYQSAVIAQSPGLVEELKEWLKPRRDRARALHKENIRFPLSTPAEKLTPRQRVVVDFLLEKVKPAIEQANWNEFARYLDQDSSRGINQIIVDSIVDSEGIPDDVYRSYFQSMNLSSRRPDVRNKSEEIGAKKFLRKTIENLVEPHPDVQAIAESEIIAPLRKQLFSGELVYLVQTKNGYRIFNPGYLQSKMPDRDLFQVQLRKTNDQWELHF